MATFTTGDMVPYGDAMVQMGVGVIPEPQDHCKYCGTDFELAEDEDERGNPIIYVEIPIDLGLVGKYCTPKCQWQAAYEAAIPEVKEGMRNLYKSLAGLAVANTKALREHLKKWDELGGPYLDVRFGTGVNLKDMCSMAADMAKQFDSEGSTPWTVGL